MHLEWVQRSFDGFNSLQGFTGIYSGFSQV